MNRTSVTLFRVVCVLLAGAIVSWFALVYRKGEPSGTADLLRALHVLQRVRDGESRCYARNSQFAPLAELGPGGCGGLDSGVSAGTDDGFSVEVHAAAGGFSAKVHPLSSLRSHSLYLDRSGAVHIGTRDHPASAESPLLSQRR
jgi:hypothetical protein